MPTRSFILSCRRLPAAVLVTACVAASASAQGIGSEPRSITLLATKAPPFDALEAVHVSTLPPKFADDRESYELPAVVEIRDEGHCEIRAVQHAPAVRIGVRSLSPIFSGDCHESAPAHAMSIRVAGAGILSFEIECTHAGVLRRWLVDLPLSGIAPAR